MQDDYCITIRDAASALDISPSTVRRYLKQGRLQGVRESRSDGTERYLLSRSSIIALEPGAEAKLPEGSAIEAVVVEPVSVAANPEASHVKPAGAVSRDAHVTVLDVPSGDMDFLQALETNLEREVESHQMVPVELYRELREKYVREAERSARLEGELEGIRKAHAETLESVEALQIEFRALREALEQSLGSGVVSRFRDLLKRSRKTSSMEISADSQQNA